MDLGELVIASVKGVESNSTFRLSVGRAGTTDDGRDVDNALYLTYAESGGLRDDLALLKRLKDGETMGLEFAKPEGKPRATTRVSMYSELTGQYVRVGTSDSAQPSHVFVDGVIDKKCPFLFNAGSNDGKFTQVCLDQPDGDSDIVFPDVSGVVITSGNSEDLRSVPGLEGDDPLMFTGTVKVTSRIDQPPPRVGMCDYGAGTGQCTVCRSRWSPLLNESDVYRLYYTVSRWDVPRLQVSDYVLAGLRELANSGASRDDLASALSILRRASPHGPSECRTSRVRETMAVSHS